MDLVEEDLAAHPEQVAHGHPHALLRQDGVDLGLEAGAQMDELASIADELAQFAQRWWGDPGFGEASHAEQVDQVRGIALDLLRTTRDPRVEAHLSGSASSGVARVVDGRRPRDFGERGHAEVDRVGAPLGDEVHLGELLARAVEAHA